MIPRLTISLTPEEREALERMVEADFRPPKEQIRWLVREEARRRGLLPVAKAGKVPEGGNNGRQ